MSTLVFNGKQLSGGIPKGQVKNILDNFANDYDPSSTYAVNDYCMYNGLLYKCITAITEGEAFDATKWSKTDCGSEIREINNNIAVENVKYDNSESGLVADNVQDAIDEVNDKADTATNIAKGRNQAHVFATTEAMQTWLSNADNKGQYNVGDNLYIIDVGVPDWWVSEVLTEVDTETGYFYKIAPLETQKVDLTEINTAIDGKVSKVEGKGLSTEDYTTEEKNKLNEIANNGITNTVEGENPTINNSTDGNLIYLKNNGYTEQKTLSGKNLLNAKLNTNIGSNDAYSGIKVKPSTKYTLTLKQKCVNRTETATVAQHWIAQKDADGNTITGTNKAICFMTFSNVNEVLTKIESFTTSSDTDTLYLDLGNYLSSALALQTIEAQLEEGGATTYEPYCGGISSPNPNYPQHVDGLGDNGYFDGVLKQGGYKGIDGSYDSSLTNYICNTNSIPCNNNDTVNLVYEETIDDIVLLFYGESGYISYKQVTTTDKIETTVPSGATSFNFRLSKTGLTPSTAKHISVTINGQYAVRVKTCGKNVLDIKEENSLITSTDGTIISQNDCVYAIVDVRNWDRVTLRGDFTLLGNSVLRVGYCTEYPNVDVKATRDNWYGNNVYNVSAYNYLLLTFVTNGTSTTTDFINSFFLEYGSVTDATYESHQSSTALIPISAPLYDGDYIEVFADGSGREYRKMSSIVYDGSDDEEWIVFKDNIFRIVIPDAKTALQTSKCSHFANVNQAYNGDVGTYCDHTDTNKFFNTEFSNISDWKAWLQSNPMTVVYELAQPTSTPLTAEQVAELMKLQTFKGVTHVSADGEVYARYYCNTDNGDTVNRLQEIIINLEKRVAELENSNV